MAQHATVDDHRWGWAFVTVWMRYVERFERRDDVWRIARRKVVVEWIRRDTAEMWDDLPDQARGRRDWQDPIYER
jgi:hypothetical protein